MKRFPFRRFLSRLAVLCLLGESGRLRGRGRGRRERR